MISQLRLHNFRSFTALQLPLGAQRIILYGPNGIGKTNLLESIYYCATTKSFRAADADLVHYGEDFFTAQLDFLPASTKLLSPTSIQMRFAQPNPTNPGKRKQLLINHRRQPLRTVLGRLPVVLFQPADLQLFTSEARTRRQWLDMILIQATPDYAAALAQYKKALQQRNALLRQYKLGEISARAAEDQLFAWDLQLELPAAVLIAARRQLVAHFNDTVGRYYAQIAHTKLPLKLDYQTNSGEQLSQSLAEQRGRDLAAGHSTVGPHRDEVAVDFGGQLLTSRASRGETRTVLLALKLAELAYLEHHLSKKPTLLLDDVFSELDQSRRQYLLDNLADHQTIITTTELGNLAPSGAQLVAVAELADGARAH